MIKLNDLLHLTDEQASKAKENLRNPKISEALCLFNTLDAGIGGRPYLQIPKNHATFVRKFRHVILASRT